MASSDTILISKEGALTTIRLNRPERYNSFNREMAFALQEVLKKCADDGTRCLLITGEGKAFCAGQDLNEATDPNGPALQTIVAEHYNPIIQLIRDLPLPVVAAVNGAAAGAGANIALACDIVLAHEQSYFLQAFCHIGLIPDSGGTYHLPRLIGFQRASAQMMLGEKIPAPVAEQMGMIYKSVPADEWEKEIQSVTGRLVTMPTRGLALTKRALNVSLVNSLPEQLEVEEHMQTIASKTADYAEGVNAFLEKRKANFIGA